jgi:hypothetical protein
VPPEPRGWAGLAGGLPPDAAALALPSPFPHEAFVGTGLETFRWYWASADRLLRAGAAGETVGAPQQARGRSEFGRTSHGQQSHCSITSLITCRWRWALSDSTGHGQASPGRRATSGC